MLRDTRKTWAIQTVCEPGDMTAYRVVITPDTQEGWVKVSSQFNGQIEMSVGGCVEYVKRMQEQGIEERSPAMYQDYLIDYVRSHHGSGDLNPWTAIAIVKTVAELFLMGEIS